MTTEKLKHAKATEANDALKTVRSVVRKIEEDDELSRNKKRRTSTNPLPQSSSGTVDGGGDVMTNVLSATGRIGNAVYGV